VRGEQPQHVFTQLIRFERYPDLAPHVRATTVHETWPAPEGSSSWELHFRSGLLRWTETERFDLDALEIHFEQTDGDFDSFVGKWVLSERDGAVTVHFEVDFDFGIPSMEGILDPIAERVIRETVAWSVMKMFADASIPEDANPVPAAGQ
jgi:ribosome-associated toxin RatA of RatAB toxin-antitoxin module